MERYHHAAPMAQSSSVLAMLSMAMRLVQQIHQTPRLMLLMLAGHDNSVIKSESSSSSPSVGEISAELQIKLSTAMQYLGDLEKLMAQLIQVPQLNFDGDFESASLMASDDPGIASVASLSRLNDAASLAILEFSRHSNRWRQSHRLAGTSFAAIKQPNTMTLTYPPAAVVAHLNQFRQAGPEISIDFKQNVSNTNEPGVTVLIMTISRVCRVMIALHGLLPEWLIVRGISEPYIDANGKPNLFTPSETQTFRAMTNCCLVAMQTVSASLRESKLKNLLTWLQSYRLLFVQPCQRCGRLLDREFLPPVWRDVRSPDHGFHLDCR